MKQIFNKKSLLLLCCSLFLGTAFCGNSPKQEIYQLTLYHYTTAAQEAVLDTYCKDALLPALHRLGYKNIGVFKALANDTSIVKSLYVYLPLKKLDDQLLLNEKLNKDTAYLSAGTAYLNADFSTPPYSRMEVMVLKAFPLAPQMQLPNLTGPKSERVYELRSYESSTEKIFRNKVKMFNEGGEIGLFKRLNFNAVFYSEVIAGSHMPNLMYMTTFENKADRDAHWKTFGSDPFWKTLSAMPEYQHNVSLNDSKFLRPTEYSDF
jgi:hypothetical protein